MSVHIGPNVRALILWRCQTKLKALRWTCTGFISCLPRSPMLQWLMSWDYILLRCTGWNPPSGQVSLEWIGAFSFKVKRTKIPSLLEGHMAPYLTNGNCIKFPDDSRVKSTRSTVSNPPFCLMVPDLRFGAHMYIKLKVNGSNSHTGSQG